MVIKNKRQLFKYLIRAYIRKKLNMIKNSETGNNIHKQFPICQKTLDNNMYYSMYLDFNVKCWRGCSL